MATFETTVEREDTHTVLVEYNYTAACRGRRDSLMGKANAGPPLEPDSPAEIEIVRVLDMETNAELELFPNEETRIRELCYEDASNR